MIRIENTEVYGWESAVRGMRNPMNSWDKSDSGHGCLGVMCDDCIDDLGWCEDDSEYIIGGNDLALMKSLVKAGSDHAKFMRMITVTCDITAPMYWWKEADTYKVGTVRNSCSTMHKIHSKEFTLDDFSHGHLIEFSANPADSFVYGEEELFAEDALKITIRALNHYRSRYIATKDKRYWWQMIQLLPSSYNQRSTWQANYAVLRNIYHARRNHKLDCWKSFCEWIEGLPYSELITE